MECEPAKPNSVEQTTCGTDDGNLKTTIHETHEINEIKPMEVEKIETLETETHGFVESKES